MHKYDCNLWEFLKRKTIEDFGLQKRMKLAIKVVEELTKVHKTKIVHRDIKPSNIMLDSNMNPVLIDFGIGESIGFLKGSVGTPGFTAPEQISGDKQTYPVDMFSLGKLLVVILFEWRISWLLLYSPKKSIESKKLDTLRDVLDIISRMLQVNNIYNYGYTNLNSSF